MQALLKGECILGAAGARTDRLAGVASVFHRNDGFFLAGRHDHHGLECLHKRDFTDFFHDDGFIGLDVFYIYLQYKIALPRNMVALGHLLDVFNGFDKFRNGVVRVEVERYLDKGLDA